MSDNKRYYWLKLKDTFFEEKTTKFLRKLPDGDKLVITYLKMQLKSLKANGIIKYDRLMPSCEEELSLILDEDINIVKFTIRALLQSNAIEILDDNSIYMIAVQELIGKESGSAERVRRFRENKKVALHCNTNVQKCNTEIDIEKDIDIDIERDIDIDIERDIEKIESAERKNTNGTKSGQCPTTTTTNRKRFTPPTLQEVQDYCNERGNGVNAENFIDYYTANGWRVGKNPMKDWKACVRTWERTEYNRKSGTESKKGVTFYELGKERGIFKDEF